jgi:hypothetical protein
MRGTAAARGAARPAEQTGNVSSSPEYIQKSPRSYKCKKYTGTIYVSKNFRKALRLAKACGCAPTGDLTDDDVLSTPGREGSIHQRTILRFVGASGAPAG